MMDVKRGKTTHPNVNGKLDHVRQSFESWSEFTEFAGTAKSSIPTDSRVSRSLRMPKWAGTPTFSDACDLALLGWQSEAQKIRELSAPIFELISSLIVREDIVYGVEGQSIDIARFVQNEPECWQSFEAQIIEAPHAGSKVVRLHFNQGASARISAESIRKRGIAATALIELLEYSGLRVEVIVGTASYSGGLLWETYIKVKDAAQNVDLPRLTYALAHPSMLRRLLFSNWEAVLTPDELRKAEIEPNDGGYGHPEELLDQGDIYIGNNNREFEDTQSWLIEQLKKSGVKMSGDLSKIGR